MKIGGGLKFLVDAGKSDEGDRIQVRKCLHDALSNLGGLDFRLTQIEELAFDGFRRFYEALVGDRSLATGDEHALEDLFSAEFLPGAISLDDEESWALGFLEGIEPTIALFTFSPTSNRIAISGWTGIEDTLLWVSTIGALHDDWAQDIVACPYCNTKCWALADLNFVDLPVICPGFPSSSRPSQCSNVESPSRISGFETIQMLKNCQQFCQS